MVVRGVDARVEKSDDDKIGGVNDMSCLCCVVVVEEVMLVDKEEEEGLSGTGRWSILETHTILEW